MDQTRLLDLFELYFNVLELNQSSSEEIVDIYTRTLEILFEDNVYNCGRYFVADKFAYYIAKRVSHVDKYDLFRKLREVLEKKWRS